MEACGSVPLLPNCGSLPSAWLSPYTHRPLLATAGTRKGLNSQTPFSPPLLSSCFKLILVHFLALNWPKCLVAGLPWERTWDEPDVCKGVCLHICCWPRFQALQTVSGSIRHLFRLGGVPPLRCVPPPRCAASWLSKPGWGPDPHSRVGATGSSWCRALFSFTTSPSYHQLPQWVVREPQASSGVRGPSKSQKQMEGAGEEQEEE